MSALRQLAEKATPRPWVVTKREINSALTQLEIRMPDGEPIAAIDRWSDEADDADASLIALAPDLARVAADLADALNMCRIWHDQEEEVGLHIPEILESRYMAALAAFDALEQRVKETGTG